LLCRKHLLARRARGGALASQGLAAKLLPFLLNLSLSWTNNLVQCAQGTHDDPMKFSSEKEHPQTFCLDTDDRIRIVSTLPVWPGPSWRHVGAPGLQDGRRPTPRRRTYHAAQAHPGPFLRPGTQDSQGLGPDSLRDRL